MKNIIILFSALTMIPLIFTSCSKDEVGIDYDLKAPSELIFKPGETATFEFNVSDDTGISKIEIRESSLGIDIIEEYTPSESELNYTFDITIPESQRVGSEIGINVDIFDNENNSLFEIIKISIEE